MDTKEQFFKELTSDLSLSIQDLNDFSELFVMSKYSASDYFVQLGELTRTCGFVKNGIMRAYISDSEGEEANLRFILKYGFISGSFAKGATSSMNIQSLVDCEIYIANWDSISEFLKSHKILIKFFNTLLASGHQSIVQRLSTYLRNNAKQRYELFLKEYPNLINQIPHYHVANFIGITTVQLSRIRQKIAHEKIRK
jgi:CRP-like cAMP-binding protein